jgi:hypothetical protein
LIRFSAAAALASAAHAMCRLIIGRLVAAQIGAMEARASAPID